MDNKGLSGAILYYLGLSGSILDYLGLSWSILEYLGVSGTIWDYLGLSGTRVQVEAGESKFIATSVSARWRVPYAVEENLRGMTERMKKRMKDKDSGFLPLDSYTNLNLKPGLGSI